ncbi:uroporphyrinogen-III synthase [Bombella saccharophila]|uniref:Uroporphyrinogen-III synthase n=1 Tax=Bombella saccharophila TaxID=2967338 RepID=A0ABT3W4J1_9PROT|nr:uroporphyrinogen-III synthase [Bombella saccharophila]MCX5613947.1 uroporphyrinogen-III synthase [Bombella saccharophila]
MMRRVVLITRPEPGLRETLARVQAQGWHGVASPVMHIQPTPPIADYPCQAMLVTSRQVLPFLAHQNRERLVLTVGEATARHARAMGFQHVEAASGDQEALEALCQQKGLRGPSLVLACGRGRDGQLYGAGLVQSLGVQRLEAYHVRPVPSLSDAALRALAHDEVTAILFYSRETVTLFMELCPAELRAVLRHCRALCLSEAIAAHARSYDIWGEVEFGPPLTLLGHI